MVMAVHFWVGVKESELLELASQELESETKGYWVPRWMPSTKWSCVAQDDFELTELRLSVSSESWDYRCVPPLPDL